MNFTLAEIEAHNRKHPPALRQPGKPSASLAGASKPPKEIKPIRLVFAGQIRGGKNNMGTTKSGMHYAKKPFKVWRDDATAQIKSQLPHDWTPINQPINISLQYFAGDKRRRDMPAIVDAIFHVLERAGFCEDDTHLWIIFSSRHYDKAAPRAIIFTENWLG